MTDNEIVKALECCSNAEDILVKDKTYKAKPLSSLFKDALDLINRQKAQNERDIKVKVEALYKVNDLKLENERLKAEIERLKKRH